MKTLHQLILAAALFTAVAFTGCTTPASTASYYGHGVDDIARIGAMIQNEPERMTAILLQAGLTEAQFEEVIRRISSDPRQSAAYRRAFEQHL